MAPSIRRRTVLVTVLFAAAVTSLGGQTARPAFDRKAVEISYQKFVLDNGLTLLVHTDHARAGRGREPLLPRRLAQRAARARPASRTCSSTSSSTAPSTIRTASARRWTTWAPTTATAPPARTAPTSSRTCRRRRSSGRSSSKPTASGSSAADQPGDARARTRRGAEREAAGREPALRAGVQPHLRADVSQGHPYSWPVIGSMEDLNAASLADVKELVRQLLRPEQRGAGAGRRHHGRTRAGAGEEVLRRHSRRPAGGTRRAVGAPARWRRCAIPCSTACRRRASIASITRRRGATRTSRACSCLPACSAARAARGSTAGWSTTWISPPP